MGSQSSSQVFLKGSANIKHLLRSGHLSPGDTKGKVPEELNRGEKLLGREETMSN